jgi:hypothetical protein
VQGAKVAAEAPKGEVKGEELKAAAEPVAAAAEPAAAAGSSQPCPTTSAKKDKKAERERKRQENRMVQDMAQAIRNDTAAQAQALLNEEVMQPAVTNTATEGREAFDAAVNEQRERTARLGALLKEKAAASVMSVVTGISIMEQLWPVILKQVEEKVQEEKDKRDKEAKEKIKKIRERLKKMLERNKRERERRKKNRRRKRNMEEKRRLEERRKKLWEDREKRGLDRRGQEFEDKEKEFKERDQQLREDEDIAKQKDPNGRGEEVKRIRAEREKLQRERIKTMKEKVTWQKEVDTWEREYRQYNAEKSKFDKKLDRGEGMTKTEWKDHMLKKERRKLNDQKNKLYEEHSRLDKKTLGGNKRTPQEERRFKEVERQIKELDGKIGKYNDAIKGTEKNLRETNGGTWDELAKVPVEDLEKRGAKIEKTMKGLDEVEERIGKGGKQPEYGDKFGKKMKGIHDKAGELNKGIEPEFKKYEEDVAKYDKATGELNLEEGVLENEIKELRIKLLRRQGTDADRRKKAELEKKLEDVKKRRALNEKFMQDSRNAYQNKYQKYEEDFNKLKGEADTIKDDLMLEDLNNWTTSYNKSYGDTIDKDGKVDMKNLEKRVKQLETFTDAAGDLTNAINDLQKRKDRLTESADGKPSLAERMKLSPEQIKTAQGQFDDQLKKGHNAQDKLIGDMGSAGFELESRVDSEGNFRKYVIVKSNNPLVATYSQAVDDASRELVGSKKTPAGKETAKVASSDKKPKPSTPVKKRPDLESKRKKIPAAKPAAGTPVTKKPAAAPVPVSASEPEKGPASTPKPVKRKDPPVASAPKTPVNTAASRPSAKPSAPAQPSSPSFPERMVKKPAPVSSAPQVPATPVVAGSGKKGPVPAAKIPVKKAPASTAEGKKKDVTLPLRGAKVADNLPAGNVNVIEDSVRWKEFEKWIKESLGGAYKETKFVNEVLIPQALMMGKLFGIDDAEVMINNVMDRFMGDVGDPVDFLAEMLRKASHFSVDNSASDASLQRYVLYINMLRRIMADPRFSKEWGLTDKSRGYLQDHIDYAVEQLKPLFKSKLEAAGKTADLFKQLEAASAYVNLFALSSQGDKAVDSVLKQLNGILQKLGKDGALTSEKAIGTLLTAIAPLQNLAAGAAKLGEKSRVQVYDTLAKALEIFAAQARKFADKDKYRNTPIELEWSKQANLADLQRASALLGAGKFADALSVLDYVRTGDPGVIRQRALTWLQIASELERKWDKLSPELKKEFTREKIGDIATNARFQLLSIVKNPTEAAMVGVDLIRGIENAGYLDRALQVLRDQVMPKAGNDPVLKGLELHLQIKRAKLFGNAAGIKALVEKLPEKDRAAALSGALAFLDAVKNKEALDTYDKVIDSLAGLTRDQKNGLHVKTDLARLQDLTSQHPASKRDDRIMAKIKHIRRRLRSFPRESSAPIRATLDKLEKHLQKAFKWRKQLSSGRVPKGGYTMLAREALAAGRLDIAGDALAKQIEYVVKNFDYDSGPQPLIEVAMLMSLVDKRLQDPSLSESEKAAFNEFLGKVKKASDTHFKKFLTELRQSFGKGAKFNAAKGITDGPRIAEQDKKLRNIRILARMQAMISLAGLSGDELQTKLGQMLAEARKRVRNFEAALERQYSTAGESVKSGKVGATVQGLLADLDALRAMRDGLRDLALNKIKFRGVGQYEPGKGSILPPSSNRYMALRELESELNGVAPLGTDASPSLRESHYESSWKRGARNSLLYRRSAIANSGDAKDMPIKALLAENKVKYLERRRMELIFEDKSLTLDQQRELLLSLFKHEAGLWEKLGKDVSPLLMPELTGIGKRHLDMAKSRYAYAEQTALGFTKQDFESARNKDPQKAFLALVKIREANLTGEIDLYVNYLNDSFWTRGPVKGIGVGLYGAETGEKLNRYSMDQQKVHTALIRAAFRSVRELSDEDKKILTERGFLVNGKYTIPKGIRLEPITAASDFVKATTSKIDKYVNIRQGLELAATVAIPGGIAARMSGRALTGYTMAQLLKKQGLEFSLKNAARFLASKEGAKWTAAWIGERFIEGALFTAMNRAARTALNPEMLMNPELWSLSALGGEYLHSVGVLSALRLVGVGNQLAKNRISDALKMADRSARAGRLFELAAGTAAIATEAEALTQIAKLADGPITNEDRIGNIMTIIMLRATHLGKGEGAKGKVSQIHESMKIYDRFLRNLARQQKEAALMSDPAAIMLRDKFGGDWDKARKAYQNKEISEQEMAALFKLRKRVVDQLAREIVNELGGDVKAFGSENLTSDYDISFYGPKAELAVMIFNARMSGRWGVAKSFGGREGAIAGDTNPYTNPRYGEHKGTEVDVLHQDRFGHMAMRKYSTDAQWQAHRKAILDSTPPAKRDAVRKALDYAEAKNKEFKQALVNKAEELGLLVYRRRPDNPNVQAAAQNRLYEQALKKIIELQQAFKDAPADKKAELSQKIRDAQGEALYFAPEAYQTEAAIRHVVENIQAGKLKYDVDVLVGRKALELVKGLSPHEGRQSFLEQFANTLKEFNHPAEVNKLTGKVAKYFVRALHAARIAGINLSRFEALIKRTIEVEANRSDVDALKALHKAAAEKGNGGAKEFITEVLKALESIAGELHKLPEFGYGVRERKIRFDSFDGGGAPPAAKPKPAPKAPAPVSDSGSGVPVLGKVMAKGGFAEVFTAKGNDKIVIKFVFKDSDPANKGNVRYRTRGDVVNMIARNSKLLKEAGIPQMEVLRYDATGERPYLVVERAGEGIQIFKPGSFKPRSRKALIEKGEWSAEHEQAVARLFVKLAEAGLVFRDAKYDNLFFRRVKEGPDKGKLEAGILDHDMIGKWEDIVNEADAYMADMVFEIDWLPTKHNIKSLTGSNRRTTPFSGALEFMTKMLEHKGWIEFNEASKSFETELINPENIKDILPLDKFINYKGQSILPLRILRLQSYWKEAA